MWIQRESQEQHLREFFAGSAPSMALVRGSAGHGRSALVRRCLPSRDVRWHTFTPLDAGNQEALLRGAWQRADPETDDSEGLFLPLPVALAQEREPTVLVLDDVDASADPARLASELDRLWQAVRAQALPLHLVLIGTDAGLDRLVEARPVLTEVAALDLAVGTFSPAHVAASLPDWPAAERFLAWTLFGGAPSRLQYLDPGVRLATNVQRAFLDPSGPLYDAAPALLARTFQKPERYAGLVLALAQGASDWGALREAVPEFTTSSQLAPYLASLEAHGLVEARRSLDARPRSRNRRYELADPFPGSWYRLVLPHRDRLATEDPSKLWKESIGPALSRWAGQLFPRACRDYLVAVGGSGGGALPAPAREVGGLWGDGYDLPAAGTLRNGSPLYGRCVWGRTATVQDAKVLADAVRATRYGFGREARIRTIFAGGGVDHELRRQEARDPLLTVVILETVLGL